MIDFLADHPDLISNPVSHDRRLAVGQHDTLSAINRARLLVHARQACIEPEDGDAIDQNAPFARPFAR